MTTDSLYLRRLADGPGRPLVLSHAPGLDHVIWADVGEALRAQLCVTKRSAHLSAAVEPAALLTVHLDFLSGLGS